jgi:hypothetical protein
VEITLSRDGMTCEWDPEPMPLTTSEMARYRDTRNACASDLARLVGRNVLLGDLTSDGLGLTGLLCFYPDGRVERV